MPTEAYDVRTIRKHMKRLNTPEIVDSPSFQILGFNGGSPLVEGIVHDINDRVMVPVEYDRCKIAITDDPLKHLVSGKLDEECVLTLHNPETQTSLMATMGPDYVTQISRPDKFIEHLISQMINPSSRESNIEATFVGDDFRKLTKHAPVLMSTGYEPASGILSDPLLKKGVHIIGSDTGSVYPTGIGTEPQDISRLVHMYNGKVTSCRLQNHYNNEVIGGVAILLTTPDNKVIMNLRDDIPNIAYPNHWSLLCGGIEREDLEAEIDSHGQYISPGIIAAKRELSEELMIKDNGMAIPYQPDNITIVDMNTDGNTGGVRYIVHSEYKGRLDDLILMEGAEIGAFSPEQVQGMKVAKDYKQVVKNYFKSDKVSIGNVSGF